jgi:hypothetical protein
MFVTKSAASIFSASYIAHELETGRLTSRLASHGHHRPKHAKAVQERAEAIAADRKKFTLKD